MPSARVTVRSADAVLIQFMNPALAFLGKYFPLFYTTPIILLPLARTPSLLSAVKLMTHTILLWMCLLLGFAGAIVLLSKLFHLPVPAPLSPSPPLPLKRLWLLVWGVLSLSTGLVSWANRSSGPILVVYQLSLVLFMYCTCASLFTLTRRPPYLRFPFLQLLHPIITTSLLSSVILSHTWPPSFLSYSPDALSFYSRGTNYGPGAGDFIQALLGPAIIGLAFKLYGARVILMQHALDLGIVLISGTLIAFLLSASLAALLSLGPTYGMAAVLRVLTAPVALTTAPLFDVNPSIATALPVLTGVLGAALNVFMLDACRIRHVVARGVGCGFSSMGLGTAAFVVDSPTSAGISAVTFSLVAVQGVAYLSIPALANFLRDLASVKWHIPIT